MEVFILLVVFTSLCPLSFTQSMQDYFANKQDNNFCIKAKRVEEQSSQVLDTQLEYLWYELDTHLPRTFTAVARARLILDQKRWRLFSTSAIGGSFSNLALVGHLQQKSSS